MLKRPHYIALGLVVLLTLVMLNLPSKTTARMKLGIGSLFVPLFGLANTTHQVADKAGDTALSRAELLRLNESLSAENKQLRLQASRLEELNRENDRLRQHFGWQQLHPRKYKLTRVVLQDPANWWRSVEIDAGSRDGIRTNLPVLTINVSGEASPFDVRTNPVCLVGRVFSVSLTRSQVVLVGDPNCKVAAQVDRSQARGIIGPAGPLEQELVELSYLSGGTSPKPGDSVKTAGSGGLFPKDIPIGTVVDAHPGDYGLTVARVKLAANLNALSEVWVIMEP
jgi:rod shape-determining protein MreC